MRRTLGLVLLVAVGVVLLLVMRGPLEPRRAGPPSGPGMLGLGHAAVRGLEVELDGRHLAARRVAEGWELDDRSAAPPLAAALDDLVTALVQLRPIDRFRAGDPAGFGFASPRGTIRMFARRRQRELVLGKTTLSGSALYARRTGDERVTLIGVGLLSAIERVFYYRDVVRRQRPETG